MSKDVELNVVITVTEDVTTKKQVADIVENALKGLVSQAIDGDGLAGEDFGGCTDGIEVSAKYPDGDEFCQTWDYHSNEITTL